MATLLFQFITEVPGEYQGRGRKMETSSSKYDSISELTRKIKIKEEQLVTIEVNLLSREKTKTELQERILAISRFTKEKVKGEGLEAYQVALAENPTYRDLVHRLAEYRKLMAQMAADREECIKTLDSLKRQVIDLSSGD